MQEIVYLYWRDIPAQVIVGKGRKAAKVQLPERFEQAIDRCAMKVGAKDTDAYLGEWRRAKQSAVDGEPAEVAARLAAAIDREFDAARLRELIANDGWSTGGSGS